MIAALKIKILKHLKNQLLKVNNISVNSQLCENVIAFGSTISRDVKVKSNTKIYQSEIKGIVCLGENNYIKEVKIEGDFVSGQNCKLYGCTIFGNIFLGNYSSLWGPNLDIVSGSQKVIIGNFCSIARNVSMQTFNHNSKKITSYFIGQNLFEEQWGNEKVSKGDIIIENDVWIGSHCVVLGGVTIANGSVVAANSVVTKDVPPYSIVAGTPAKVIGYRFDSETINNLQKMAWWNWSIDKIKNNKLLFEGEINDSFKTFVINE